MTPLRDPRPPVPSPRRARPALAALAAALALVTAGCGGGSAPGAQAAEGSGAPPPGFDAGEFFGRVCAGCHGPEGRGEEARKQQLKPAHLDLLDVSSRVREDRELLEVILRGGRGMPGFRGAFTDAQAEAMVAHVRELQGAATIPLSTGPAPVTSAPSPTNPGRPPSEAPPELEEGATPEAGAELFRASCVLCHGPEGRGNARMAPMLRTTPGALDLRDAGTLARDDDALTRVILEGRERMPRYKGQFTSTQLQALVAFLRAGEAR